MDSRNHHPQAAVWSLYRPSSTKVESAIVANPYKPGADDQETVLEKDHRRPVDRGDFADGGKFRSVVKILAAFNNGSGGTEWMMGSGWLISPETVVTAGHVVYDWKFGYQRAKEIKCFIGYAGRASVDSEKHDVQARLGERVITTLEWVQSGPRIRTHDVAFIKLDRPFEGDLNMFPVQDPTPVSDEVRLGVVGYPGDKELPGSRGEDGEGGALMYQEFARTEYDLQDSTLHMIEYRVSTYGGQSGGPVLKVVEGGSMYIAIGTHCYGFGPGTQNSGNSIGGRYGVDYDNFIVLFQSPSFPHAHQGIKIVRTGATKVAKGEYDRNGNTERTESEEVGERFDDNGNNKTRANGNGHTYLKGHKELNGHIDKDRRNGHVERKGHGDSSTFGDEEGFFKVLAKIAGPVVSTVGPFFGPAGAVAGIVAGTALSAIGGSESAIIRGTGDLSRDVDEILKAGAAERAILAEASFQVLLKLEETPQSRQLLATIAHKDDAFKPNLNEIARITKPYLTESALYFASDEISRLQREKEAGPQETARVPLHRQKLHLDHSRSYSREDEESAFFRDLMKPTYPVTGEEGLLTSLGPVLVKGFQFAKPILKTFAVDAIHSVVKSLSGGSESIIEDLNADSRDTNVRLVYRRAIAAEATLETLMALPKKDLDSLRIVKSEGNEEGLFDAIKDSVQRMAPTVIDIAKTAAREALSQLAKAAVNKLDGSLKSSSSQEAQQDTGRNDRLSKQRHMVRPQKSILDIIGDFEESNTPAKVRNNPVNYESEDERTWQATIEATLTSRESTWVRSPEGRKSWDSNSDGLYPMNEAYL
ncbi:ATP synthase F1 [Colletotrichum abscissum]|uniref:Serine protease n=1 Tax=Colletotrichum abscissum TaxID=1671311 RepID=A0A9P9XCR2_9PEZI|nr:ATP synthase F1 [Colletotrichum abscissum]